MSGRPRITSWLISVPMMGYTITRNHVYKVHLIDVGLSS